MFWKLNWNYVSIYANLKRNKLREKKQKNDNLRQFVYDYHDSWW